jgi:hypothetical protein
MSIGECEATKCGFGLDAEGNIEEVEGFEDGDRRRRMKQENKEEGEGERSEGEKSYGETGGMDADKRDMEHEDKSRKGRRESS